MEKYKVQMANKYTEEVVEDLVDDQVFDSEEDAQEYASYLNGCAAQEAEILKLSNQFDYEEDYGDGENFEYIAVEIEE